MFQLWRAFGTLPDYVCVGGRKRSEINTLISALRTFKDAEAPAYPFNCLFIAEPGSGKSYLARCLSKKFDWEFIDYSIAQMGSTRDVLDSLRVIVSTQKRSSRKLLIFIDEIDAEIEGHTALGLFLGPMWDGVFKIDGYTNKIDPCVWVFASTKPCECLRGLSKGRDFLSRINGPRLGLDFLTEEDRIRLHDHNKKELDRLVALKAVAGNNYGARTELAYQAVNLLNRLFGPIAKIDEDVLGLFYRIMPVNGMRSLEIFVARFDVVTKACIKKANVPALESTRSGAGNEQLRFVGKHADLNEHILFHEEEWVRDKFARERSTESLRVKIKVNPEL